MQTSIRFALACALSLTSQGVLAQSDVEPMPVLRASEVLPANLLSGPYHRVNEEVRSDGYLNYYTIESDFGPFVAHSNLMLAVRVREFQALAELERVSKTEVFAHAAVDAGLSPARAVVSFVKNPVSTVTGIPKGIGRMFKRYARAGKEGVSTAGEAVSSIGDASPCEAIEDKTERGECKDQEQGTKRARSLYERYFKISDAERRWHEKLGTDPYTSNDVLYEAIKSVAWADRLGRFSIKFAGVPTIPGASYIADANKIVWSKDPYELKDYNLKVLRDAGVDEESIQQFLDNPWYSPTMETTFIAALGSLREVAGRRHVLTAATNVASEAEARFVLESIVAMTWYNAERSPILEFMEDEHFPFASTDAGQLVVILPVDYLVWTAEMSDLAQLAAEQHRTGIDPAKRELWLLGGASARAKQGITALGWTVRDNQIAVIRATARRNELRRTEVISSTSGIRTPVRALSPFLRDTLCCWQITACSAGDATTIDYERRAGHEG